ncbi:hypothetical protein B0H16DRAFT_99501, partial [Mycena metata]
MRSRYSPSLSLHLPHKRLRKSQPLTLTYTTHERWPTFAMSVVYSIPPELICEIFLLALEYTDTGFPLAIDVCALERRALWRLGHICQQWRVLALGYSPLWTSITLYTSRKLRMDKACPPAMVRTHLHRSGDGPLDVTFVWQGGYIDDPASSQSLELLLSQSNRWQSARLHLSSTLPDPILDRFRVLKGQIPHLRILEVTSGINRHSYPLAEGDAFAFSVAPQLHTLILSDEGRRHYSLVPNPQFPWSQLTYLRGSYPNQEQGLEILTAARNVVECGMTVGMVAPQYADTPHLVLHQLRRLSLEAPASFLKYLTVPAVQELWISGGMLGSLLDCLQRSSCTVVKLVVYDCFSAAPLIPILTAMPTLATLFVAFMSSASVHVINILVDALKMTGSSDICPYLSYVALALHSSCLGAFLDMAESRCFGDSQHFLSRVYVYTFQLSKSDHRLDDLRVNKLKEAGVDAQLHIGDLGRSVRQYWDFGRP